jgi:hypothetical protein
MGMGIDQAGHDHPPFTIDAFPGSVFLLQRVLLTDSQDAAFMDGNCARFELLEGGIHGQNMGIDQQGVYLHSLSFSLFYQAPDGIQAERLGIGGCHLSRTRIIA